MKNGNRFAVFFVAALFLSNAFCFAQGDAEGCKDHPLFSRMPGYRIVICRNADFDAVDFIDPDSKEKATIEGRKSYTEYMVLPEFRNKYSRVQISRNYSNAIQKIGGWAYEKTPKEPSDTNMKLIKDGKEIWARLQYNMVADYLYLTVVEKESMVQEVVASFGAGTPRPAAQTADDDVIREATQNRLCEGLKAIEMKMAQLKKSVSGTVKSHNDFKVIVGRIRSENLTPLFEKRLLGAGETAQVDTELVPAEQTRKLTQVYGQLRGIKSDFVSIRGSLQAQIADLEKSWSVIEQDAMRAAGLRTIAGASPSRQCVVQEASRIQSEMAELGTQASRLQSEMEDVNEALDQEFGQGPCSDGAIAGGGNCETCCAQYYTVTASVGTPEYSRQSYARFQCQVTCATASAARETSSGNRNQIGSDFRVGDVTARGLSQLLAWILIDINDRWSDIIRNMTR